MSEQLTYPELQQRYEDLQKSYQKVKEERDLLQIYRIAMGLTTHTVTMIDIPHRQLKQIFNEGIDSGEWTGVVSVMENAPESIIETGIIHPEDQDAYRKFYAEVYSGVPKTECTMRVMGENRGWVWFTMYAQTMFAADGTPEYAVCFSDDITVKKRAELQYNNFRDVVTSTADFVWEANLTKDIVLQEDDVTNDLFARNEFQKFSEMAETAFAAVPEEFRESVQQTFSVERLLEAYGRAQREISLEYPVQRAIDQKVIWLLATAYLTTTYEGDVVAIICVRDISDRKQKEEELRKQAQRDPLCGLYNRRFFESTAKKRLFECDEKEEPVLLIFDLDNFKQINDRWGHAFGDKVLCTIAEAMRSSFRHEDLLARVGGDEFMALVRNSIPLDTLNRRIDNLQKSLCNVQAPNGDFIDITLSIGGAPGHLGCNYEQLYLNADQALYKAKREGKNRYVAYHSEVIS